MAPLSVTETIAAPCERVFALATDLAAAPERIAGIESVEMLSDGPFGVGTRWRESRKMMGKLATEEMWITACDPPRSYTAEAESCGCHYVSTLTFEPGGESTGQTTQATFTFEGRPTTLLARLMTPLQGLMVGSLRKMIAADLADLRRAAEAPA